VINAIAALNLFDDADIPEREAFGEIEGVMVAAGRYRNRPAIQIRSDYYGFIWVTLPQAVMDNFGSEHSVSDIWRGKTLVAYGKLSYAKGGSLKSVDVINVREKVFADPIDLDSILDPEFTFGLDPSEYLDQLHEGRLA